MTALAAFDVEDASTLGEWRITPHPYQLEGFGRTARALEDEGSKSALIVMPTGTGKTVLASILARWVIEDIKGRVLFIAHTGELIQQACNDSALVGLSAEVEQSDQHARPDFTAARPIATMFGPTTPPDPRFVVGTVQTLQGDRLRKWPPGHFKLIIIDEGHHAFAVTYRNILDHFQPDWTVGFTATADRGDGEPIVGQNQVFERLTYEYFLHDAVRDGWLARPEVRVLDTSIDLRALRVEGQRDLNDHEITQALLPHVTEIVNELRSKLDGHRAVIFVPTIVAAEAIAFAFCSVGLSVASVSGKDADRSTTLAGFRDGRYQHIVNAMLLTEGWNAPFVDSAVILRPTRCRNLFVQMAGRCLRKFKDKPFGYIWGVNWETTAHDLVHPVQIFDSPNLNINKGTLSAAKALLDSGEESDIAKALKRAQAERKERNRIEIAVRAQQAKAKMYAYDPLALGTLPLPMAESVATPFDQPATDKQVKTLISLGIPEASAGNWSKKRASGFIGSQFERRDKGLSSYKQQTLLKRLGHPSPASLGFKEASREIDRLKGAG